MLQSVSKVTPRPLCTSGKFCGRMMQYVEIKLGSLTNEYG
jgi:hypothetical protein